MCIDKTAYWQKDQRNVYVFEIWTREFCSLEIWFGSFKCSHKNCSLLLKCILQGSYPGNIFNIETFEGVKHWGLLWEKKGNSTIT